MSTQEVTILPLTLGRQFAEARRRTGLDQTELGEVFGVNRTTISRWERDEHIPPFDVIVKLSQMSDWDLDLFARASVPGEPRDPFPAAGGTGGQEVSPRAWNGADVIDLRTAREGTRTPARRAA